MTKISTSSLNSNRRLYVASRFKNLRRFVAAMKQFGDAEAKLFDDLLNKVAPKEQVSAPINRERIEVETHLIPLGMAFMLGNSEMIDKWQRSLDHALARLQDVCISDPNFVKASATGS